MYELKESVKETIEYQDSNVDEIFGKKYNPCHYRSNIFHKNRIIKTITYLYSQHLIMNSSRT